MEGGQRWHQNDGVSYRLSTLTVALSVTPILPQFVIECLGRSNQQGVESLWAQIQGCSPSSSRPVMLGLQRERTSQAD